MHLRFLLMMICALGFLPVMAQDGEPDIDDFVFVEEEPKPLNLEEVRGLIGYPPEAIAQNISGNVVFRLLVDTDGSYIKHKVIHQVDPILSGAIEAHIDKLEFSPAMQGGKAVKFWVNMPFNFKLVNEEEEKIKAIIDSLTGLLTNSTDDYILYHKRGVEYSRISKFEESIMDLTKAISLNPRKNKKKKKKNTYDYLMFSHYSRAAVYLAQEKFSEALPDYEKALQFASEINLVDSSVLALVPLAHLEKGFCHARKQDFDLAKEEYQWVLKNDTSQKCTVYPLLSDIGLAEDNYADLVWIYQGLMSCEPENTFLVYSRGYYKLKTLDYGGAIQDFNETLETNNNKMIRIAAFNHTALAYMEMKQFDLANSAIKDALDVNVLNPQSYYFQGLIYEQQEDITNACKSWNKAMSYGLQGEEAEKVIALLEKHCGGYEED